uniref:NADH dehydrogenase subunit 3 n=1 Tax=Krisna furcata TaxID=1962556 RepID=UPI002551D412|nr:NADH dehydrogenase subunit 3 [Krisna furcata]WGG89426.1 NADH dehydrogenase subunit 3 [Krisna furcata]
MLNIILFCLMILTIMITLMIMTLMLSKKNKMLLQKSSPFECGYNPMSNKRLPFSMHFFLIAIIFMIFDVEIIIIMPSIMLMKFTKTMFWMITSISFLLILILGLYHEWMNGMLNWTK